jgi:hypothetical protein
VSCTDDKSSGRSSIPRSYLLPAHSGDRALIAES